LLGMKVQLLQAAAMKGTAAEEEEKKEIEHSI
jgi:hypothetical protein